MPLALSRTVVRTDACDTSSGLRTRQIHLDRALKQVLDETAAACVQFDPESWHRRFDGDSSTWVIPPTVPRAWIGADLVRNLSIALSRYNRHAGADSQLRLRAAIDHGEVEQDGQHLGGRPVTTAARLCDCDALREAMRANPGVQLGLIVSEGFYRDVVVEGERGLKPAEFTEVDVEVKLFRGKAWVHLVDGAAQVPSAGAKRPPAEPAARPAQSNRIKSKGNRNKNVINNLNIQY
ncbi:MAG TPA: hypothetical protein VGL47_10785 [Amycolatopsis sp.]|uniref:Uncharacterized protein n=1 Tax=Amycolatopsis nalaikhensis TaxID=715472 RepID=A0ABY8XZ86_9PSEU|nr:hypothetical protein [Amycolatopsis sp. 2-2]WIV61028.1 hypothetical protein QP939_21720 [Amycolatopsis sp. 2-2]